MADYPEHRCTAYDFATEKAAVADLQQRLKNVWLFNVHCEVDSAEITHRKPWHETKKGFRIDLILEPTDELIDSGWPYGYIGIECKRSGIPLGPPIIQMLQYHNATWRVRGEVVELDYIFLWPCRKQSSLAASIFAQTHTGSVEQCDAGLRFCGGEAPMFWIEGGVVDWKKVKQGSKLGSH